MDETRLLLVIGDGASPATLCAAIPQRCAAVDVLPLTSDYAAIERLCAALRATGHGCISVLNSARLVDAEIARLRTTLGPWLADVANLPVDGTALKEHLMIPGMRLSAWWLGLAAEKSPLKSAAFLRVAQLRVILATLAAQRHTLCLTVVDDAPMRASIALTCRDTATSVRHLPTCASASTGDKVKRWLRNGGAPGQVATALLAWLRLCHKVFLAHRVLGPPVPGERREHELLFVTYFPAFEQEAAAHGRFRNKYAAPLQDLLHTLGRPVRWLLVYTTLYQTSYRQAVAQAQRFMAAGEPMVLLEQHVGLRDCLRILRCYAWLARRAACAYETVTAAALSAGPLPPTAEPLWRSLWQASFLGNEAVNALFFAVAFRRAAGALTARTEDCLYYWEMQGWEKSLCAAWADGPEKRTTIGFQHASLPQNLWSCHPDAAETARHGRPSDLPLPDVVAAGGPIPAGRLEPSAFPCLTQVESVRYLYLNDTRRSARCKGPRPALLVAGSIDRAESLALLHLLVAMGPPPAGFRILLKGHPSMPFGPLLAQMGIAQLPDGFENWEEDLQGALDTAWAALVSASTVALEALACGCRVIAPVFPDAIQMNPLADFDGWCTIVASPQELGQALADLAAAGPPDDAARGWEFVNRYWNLDPALPAWTALLNRPQAA